MDLLRGSVESTFQALDKLALLLTGEDKLLKGVEISEVGSLKDELKQLKLLLEEADIRSEDEEYLKNWSKQIKELAELIEDVIDDYIYGVSQQTPGRGLINFLSKAGRLIGTLNSRRNLASNVQNIKALLVEIKKKGQWYNFSGTGFVGISTVVERYYPEFVSPLIEECFVASKWIQKSTEAGEYRGTDISVLYIEEKGETNLLKKMYERDVEEKQFDCHAWITASRSTNMEKLLKITAKEIYKEIEFDTMRIDELASILRQYLQSKKYMLVFHNVLPLKFWQVMKHILPNNDRGSKIIITTMDFSTYSEAISFDRCTVFPEPEPLSEARCWDLFCGIAFQYETEQCCPPELKQLSLEFIRMCERSPLAIVAIAELLSKKEKTMLDWKRLLDNFNSEFKSNFHLTGASKILSLSYLDLPPQLKLCFLYFSIFPKEYLIPNDKLYKLWIAEGFVQEHTGKTLEIVAEEYLNELILRNLVQACQGFNGLEKFCRVHSVVHEIAKRTADELSFCQSWDGKKSSFRGKTRRISINTHDMENFLLTNEDSQVRSVFLSNIGALDKYFAVSLFKKCKRLTLLDFENVQLEHLPSELGNLLHLKYLSLKNTKVKRLPRSVGKLHNLQTLDVRNTLLIELPIEVNKLHNLRHLLGGTCDNKISSFSTKGVRIEEGIGSLDNLQTLTTVEAHLTGIGLIRDLEKLRRLRRLGISRLTAEVVSSLCACISEMSYLESLTLHSANNYEILDLQTIPPLLFLQHLVLKGLLQKMPDWFLGLENLTKLGLSFSKLSIDPLHYLCRLPNLVSLWLYQAYDGEQLHFEEGGFPKLKLLVLRELHGLEVVEIEEGALPHLEELRMGSSPLLNEVPSGVHHLRNLKVLANYDMPSEFVLKMQPDGGSDYWKVEHVPSVLFWYRVEGRRYTLYKLGEPELLDHLQGLSSNISDITQRDVRLSFCCSDGEEDSTLTNGVNQFSFSSDCVSFFSDDILD